MGKPHVVHTTVRLYAIGHAKAGSILVESGARGVTMTLEGDALETVEMRLRPEDARALASMLMAGLSR